MGEVRYEDPFATPLDLREPSRRLRGRLAAPVTVWTSGEPAAPAGLTLSSVVVAEGRPSIVFGLMNDTAELWDAIHETRRFVVHILEQDHRALADVFAGLRPAPGGLFSGLAVEHGEWGPVLMTARNRAFCRYLDSTEAGYQQLVRGEVERIELAELDRPLTYFRGRYRSLRL